MLKHKFDYIFFLLCHIPTSFKDNVHTLHKGSLALMKHCLCKCLKHCWISSVQLGVWQSSLHLECIEQLWNGWWMRPDSNIILFATFQNILSSIKNKNLAKDFFNEKIIEDWQLYFLRSLKILITCQLESTVGILLTFDRTGSSSFAFRMFFRFLNFYKLHFKKHTH